MRYDDILHETFITSINGILANPANMSITQEEVVAQAWGVAVTAANMAKSGSTLIPMVMSTVAATSAAADPGVSTGINSGSTVNKVQTSNPGSVKPTAVTAPDGSYVGARR